MLHTIRRRLSDERGFTLIELLVVILIIGILAAIALPSFLNQRAKAQDTEAKTAARTAQTAMETWYTDEQNYQATAAQLRTIEPALNEGAASGTGLTVTSGADNYVVRIKSKSGNEFWITKAAGGAVSRECDTDGTKGCPASGTW